jgi:hypothetical protein
VIGSYFPHHSKWPAFTYKGKTYNLDHLHEYQFSVEDTDKVVRIIGVTFSDHCFTRSAEKHDDPALAYSNSSRAIGHFCFERYQLSLGIRTHIKNAATSKVWVVEGEHFAVLPIDDYLGNKVLYGIMFSLDRVTGLPVHLHMRVRTAYAIDNDIVTFGCVRFCHLVALRMKGRRPPRNVSSRRKAPPKP